MAWRYDEKREGDMLCRLAARSNLHLEEIVQADPASEWTPTWEYGQFIDVRDVADAVQRVLDVPLEGHHCVLLCSADIAATGPSLDMAGGSPRACPSTTPPASGANPVVPCSAAQSGSCSPSTWKSPRLEPSTRGSYEGYIRRTILPALGSVEVRKVRGPMPDTLYTRLRRCGILCASGKQVVEHNLFPDLS